MSQVFERVSCFEDNDCYLNMLNITLKLRVPFPCKHIISTPFSKWTKIKICSSNIPKLFPESLNTRALKEKLCFSMRLQLVPHGVKNKLARTI